MQEALSMLDRGRPVGDTHEPLWAANPEWFEGRKIITTVRDPWSWYISFYLYALQTSAGADLFGYYAGYDPESPYKFVEEARHQPEKSFKDVLYGMTHPHERPIPPNPGLIWPMPARGLWGYRWKESQIGLCSAIFYSMLSGSPAGVHPIIPSNIEVISMNRLTEWLEMQFFGYDRKPINTSVETWGRRFHPIKWYDADMHRWVQEADSGLIRSYGFELS